MFWMRLGTCSSITSFPFSSFLFFFSSYGLSVLALYITYIELFSFFLFSLWFFYINHAIATPLHPLGLLVSKKDYIYPCSRYANNPYTLVAHCFFFSFSSLSLFFSFPLLSIPFPLTWITGFLLRYAHLVFPSLHFFSFFSLFLFSFLFFADTNRL